MTDCWWSLKGRQPSEGHFLAYNFNTGRSGKGEMRLSGIYVAYKWLLRWQLLKAWEPLSGADKGKRLFYLNTPWFIITCEARQAPVPLGLGLYFCCQSSTDHEIGERPFSGMYRKDLSLFLTHPARYFCFYCQKVCVTNVWKCQSLKVV